MLVSLTQLVMTNIYMFVELSKGAFASTSTPLDWKSRLNIAMNAAHGKAHAIFANIHVLGKKP
jgi:hypothetical protein